MCQAENLDSNEACQIMLELIGHIRACEIKFSTSELLIAFDGQAIDEILATLPRGREAVRQICAGIFKICEPGLRLMSQKKGIHEVILTREAVVDPEKFINKLVETSFIV
jgi:hypothetical protein